MTFSTIRVGLTAGIVLLLCSAGARAQAADEGTVTGSGMTMIKRPPELMRMQVELSAKGKTIQEALTKLKARREAAKTKLVDLGAIKPSIVEGESHIAEATDRQRQMEMMVRERMRQMGRKAPKKTDADLVTVTGTLIAEWPLKPESADELLIAVQTLTQKIRAADISGTKEAQAAESAEEQESAEESAAAMGEFGNTGQRPPGEPRFVYVSKISAEDENKALAQAFEKAKARAVQLSHAAGAELGALRSINGDAMPNGTAEEYFASGSDQSEYQMGQYRMMMMQQRGMAGAGDEAHEAVGPEPGMVTLSVQVTTTFKLK